MRILLSFVPLALLAQAPVPPAPIAPKPAEAPLPPDQAAMKAHVMFLASDAMRGRDAGSPEYEIAAEYVAAQFQAAGLRPAGDAGSYLQRVPLVSYRPIGQGTATLNAGGRRQTLAFGRDFLPSPNPAAAVTRMTAPVVFVGYGIAAPHLNRDDFAGVDVRGKIVAFVAGSPAAMSGEERAFLGSPATKAAEASRRGAIGAVVLTTPRSEKLRLFAKSVDSYDHARMSWARPDGTAHVDTPATPILGTLSLAGVAKLFRGSTIDGAAMLREAEKPDATFRAAPLAARLTIAGATKFEAVGSSNVAGILPGSDPRLARETVVLSAHLDHVGVSGKGPDRIHNGAMDNAIGIASLIEEAKRFAAAGKPPKRSILFLAVTAEEKGLVGADWFANHPTVPIGDIVANVNLDMPILTYRFEDLVAFGGDRSTLGPIIARAARAGGTVLSPDPIPDEGIFVRSDHFRFVEKGVPAVFLWPGHKGPGKAATTDFLANRYHKPNDDLAQGIDWSQGPRFVDINYRIARDIADANARPVWNKGDYFGTRFGGPMAKD